MGDELNFDPLQRAILLTLTVLVGYSSLLIFALRRGWLWIPPKRIELIGADRILLDEMSTVPVTANGDRDLLHLWAQLFAGKLSPRALGSFSEYARLFFSTEPPRVFSFEHNAVAGGHAIQPRISGYVPVILNYSLLLQNRLASESSDQLSFQAALLKLSAGGRFSEELMNLARQSGASQRQADELVTLTTAVVEHYSGNLVDSDTKVAKS